MLKTTFTKIYEHNSWGGKESRSGPGSDSIATEKLKSKLVQLFKELEITSIVDCACGDFNWMKDVVVQVPNIDYLGVDIVDKVIEENNKKYRYSNCFFGVLDIVEDLLPKADLIICRDCLVHLSHNNINKFLKNFIESGSRYLLATSFTADRANEGINGAYGWFPINLQKAPFSLPKPLRVIDEEYKLAAGTQLDKCMLLWSREQLER